MVDFSGTDGNEGVLLEEGREHGIAEVQGEMTERTPSRVQS